MIKELKPTEFAFVIMDEIFTGTNYKEGQAGAYGVTKKLSGYNNTLALFATHYKVLTELEKATNGIVKNQKVTVIKNADGSFTFPYRLEAGITDQAIALELLQQEGFDADILEAAHEIMDRNKPEQHGTAKGA
jgi:DNA mismatch repair protein MutS